MECWRDVKKRLHVGKSLIVEHMLFGWSINDIGDYLPNNIGDYLPNKYCDSTLTKNKAGALFMESRLQYYWS